MLSGLVDLTRLCTRDGGQGRLGPHGPAAILRVQRAHGVPRRARSTRPLLPHRHRVLHPHNSRHPLSHALKPTPNYADLAEEFRHQRLRLMSTLVHILLVLRSLGTFVLSQFDYIASGVAVLPHHVQDLAVHVRHYCRHVLGLPCWASRAPQSLPMAMDGPGCDLTLQAVVQLLLTYTQASFSRNLLAQRSAAYLCSASVPGSEAEPLTAAATALGVQVVVLPDRGTKDLQIHVEGDRSALSAHPAATDGALRQWAGSGGIMFYAPGTGIVLRAWFGCLIWASPSSMEWLTRFVALSLLYGWRGTLLSSLDATSALFHSYTHLPPEFNILDAPWCYLIPTLLHLEAHHELWLCAQRDTSNVDTLALLNGMASLPTRGAREATPWTVSLLPHLHRCLVLFQRGALLVDPELSLNAAYQVAAGAAYFTARRESCLHPDGTDF